MKNNAATPLRALMLALSLILACIASQACGPRPQPPAPAPTHVASWTDTARTVLSTLQWAVPGARLVTDVLVPEPARTIVGRALDGVAGAAGALGSALDAYDARGGDRCAAKAAVAGVRQALVSTAQVLADNGLALGVVLERVADSAAALVDELVPGCDPDAGWRSEGAATNRELRELELRATARGVVLRRDLDNLRPPAGAR